MCLQKPATVKLQTVDCDGRIVARVTCDGLDANAEQVCAGVASANRLRRREASCAARDVRRATGAVEGALAAIHIAAAGAGHAETAIWNP